LKSRNLFFKNCFKNFFKGKIKTLEIKALKGKTKWMKKQQARYKFRKYQKFNIFLKLLKEKFINLAIFFLKINW
jgi:hypothetical protein